MTSVTAWMLCSIFNEAGNNENKTKKITAFSQMNFCLGVVMLVTARSEKNLSKMFQWPFFTQRCFLAYFHAGLPPGVINMVFGTGPKVGEALVSHPDVPVISFTGSTATAQKIRQACSQYSKKLSLEVNVFSVGSVLYFRLTVSQKFQFLKLHLRCSFLSNFWNDDVATIFFFDDNINE